MTVFGITSITPTNRKDLYYFMTSFVSCFFLFCFFVETYFAVLIPSSDAFFTAIEHISAAVWLKKNLTFDVIIVKSRCGSASPLNDRECESRHFSHPSQTRSFSGLRILHHRYCTMHISVWVCSAGSTQIYKCSAPTIFSTWFGLIALRKYCEIDGTAFDPL